MGMCAAVPRPRRPRRGRARSLQRLALAAARREREAADLRLQDDARRLGCLTVARAGPIGAHLLPLAPSSHERGGPKGHTVPVAPHKVTGKCGPFGLPPAAKVTLVSCHVGCRLSPCALCLEHPCFRMLRLFRPQPMCLRYLSSM